jgi:uncharacterized membrane protein YagU involved in acid resistance
MNWASWAIWGFAATVVLTTVLSLSQGIKWTRLNVPLMLGTMLTSDRDKAKWCGIFIHMLNGFIFSLVYVATFHAWGGPSWQKGAVIGLIHSLFVLAVALPNLPAIHPRMASEYYLSDDVRQLEPPGFFAINYGLSTPIAVIIAHIIFGIILGAFYKV